MGIVSAPIFEVVEWMCYTIIEKVICYEHESHYVVHNKPCCDNCVLHMQSIMKDSMIDMFYKESLPSRYFLSKVDAEQYQQVNRDKQV